MDILNETLMDFCGMINALEDLDSDIQSMDYKIRSGKYFWFEDDIECVNAYFQDKAKQVACYTKDL